jgi:metal-dependent amidase/aminoacylase/carboxypeptidase family protein
MLHEKELVLNANDTKNILNAVGILRGVTRSLGQALMNQMANISANNTSAIAGGLSADGLEQNVHIDAQFPNVVNSNEIETALNNLVNMASQHIQKN